MAIYGGVEEGRRTRTAGASPVSFAATSAPKASSSPSSSITLVESSEIIMGAFRGTVRNASLKMHFACTSFATGSSSAETIPCICVR